MESGRPSYSTTQNSAPAKPESAALTRTLGARDAAVHFSRPSPDLDPDACFHSMAPGCQSGG